MKSQQKSKTRHNPLKEFESQKMLGQMTFDEAC